MKYFFYNSDVEQSIKSIKKHILLSMNGINSDNMKNAGLHYKENFGLTLPQIKTIAAKYPPNATLAECLWNLKIRECMIIATLLYPATEFTKETASQWMNDIETSELCEYFSLNLLQQTNFALDEISQWLNSQSVQATICGYLVASRMAHQISSEQKNNIIVKIVASSDDTDFSIFRAKSVCLRYFCRESEELSSYIQSKISIFEHSEKKSERYIFEEVSQEIKFYYDR